MAKLEAESGSDAGYVHYFAKAPPDTKFQKEFKCGLIRTEAELRELTDSLTGKVVAFDTETSTLDHTIKEPLVGVSFSLSPYDGYYIPFRHKLGKNASLGLLRIYHEFLLRNQVIGYNIPFDMQMLEAEGFSMLNVKLFDAMTLVFNADTNVKGNGLKWACFPGSQGVLTEGGEIPISEVRRGDLVLLGKGKFEVLKSGPRGVKRLVKLTLDSGRAIRCTPDHRFLCREGESFQWVQAKDLLGSELVTHQEVEGFSKEEAIRLSEFLGLGDLHSRLTAILVG